MRILLIFIVSILAIVFAVSQPIIKKENNYLKQYYIADKLFNEAENITIKNKGSEVLEEKLNKQALTIFQKIIPIVEKASDDSLAFFCYLKIGILLHYFDSTSLAKENYLKAIYLKTKVLPIEDSFLFQPLLFTGRVYFKLNQFDSATIFFNKAEAITEKYNTPLKEQQRLYNSLGNIYYEIGNYKQAINYFEKAILLLSKNYPEYKDFLINYKMNIASALVKLERFTEANIIYESILTTGINTSDILLSLGIINLQIGNLNKALLYFNKVNFENSKSVIINNQIAKTYLKLLKIDSTNKYLGIAFAENKKWNGDKKNIRTGLTFQILADKFILENKYQQAIENYQQAILQFFPDYKENNIYKNPENFSGVFSYINLFNALINKADALEKLYEQNTKQINLDASLSAYNSAFLLADYVAKTYDSDEARLFLNKIKYSVHDRAINISLKLYDLTKNKNYLEYAYNFDQHNKASILSQNVQEVAIKNKLVTNNGLFEKENAIKKNITRLSLKAVQINDSSLLQKIKNEIRDYEIELGKLQNKINELPGYKAQKFTSSIPNIKDVQKLLSKKTAILSYHLTEKKLVIFCITANEFSCTNQIIDSTFLTKIRLFKTMLCKNTGGEIYNGTATSNQLYNTTIAPVLSKIQGIENLLIIPEEALNNIPFESLIDENGNFVLNKFKVQYQYSTSLLKGNNSDVVNKNILAMAPFASIGTQEFATLPYTKNEIQNLQGNILIDSAATKKNFLAFAYKSGIMHLATHTIVNDTVPEKTLIAFYSSINVLAAEKNLYVEEIYNLKLDATKLVVLSACETGTGKLARGEGLMSLARAFTYAGCPNIISTLWKADDKSTAWIIQQFYIYYNDGKDAATALQKAKLDYLKSPNIEKRFKSPPYWAHLVLTGLPNNTNSGKNMWWVIAVFFVAFLILFSLIKKRFVK